MDKIIVYIDDAGYAQQQLAPMKSSGPAGGRSAVGTHWVLVACAPRMTWPKNGFVTSGTISATLRAAPVRCRAFRSG